MKPGFEKRFNKEDLVYWCHKKAHEYSVQYGLVDEQFSDAVIIDYIVPRERRIIDGIPLDEFKSEERYRKLPKGWSYDTKLFEVTHEVLDEEENEFLRNCKITDSKGIKEVYNKGYLVKKNKIFGGNIETEITKQGFRVVKKWPMYVPYITHVSIRPDKVYFTYEEAKKEVDDNVAEFNRQAELSEYDWCVEQIDKTLSRFKFYKGLSDEEINQYREWILGLDNIENIETRISGGEIQWRYLNKKRWCNIEL